MWCHLVGKFATNASDALLLLNSIQVSELISGSVVPLAMFFQVSRNTFVHVLKNLADSFTVPVLVLFRMISTNLRLSNEKFFG